MKRKKKTAPFTHMVPLMESLFREYEFSYRELSNTVGIEFKSTDALKKGNL